jgi:hypothetical protein
VKACKTVPATVSTSAAASPRTSRQRLPEDGRAETGLGLANVVALFASPVLWGSGA